MDDDAIATRLRERVAASAFHRGLGLEVLEASPGVVRLSMPAREGQRNLLGSIHGGILATLADIAMGLAVRTDAGEERRHTTIDLDIRFLREEAGEPFAGERLVVCNQNLDLFHEWILRTWKAAARRPPDSGH